MKVQYKRKRNLLETILQVEILQGMALTLKHMFSRAITRQYPDEKPPMFPGFRGQHALARDLDSGASKCVACMRCATVCPSRCIQIRYHEEDGTRRRVVDSYEIEALRCVYCGYCVEVCPVNAIVLTEVFEYSGYGREGFRFTEDVLLGNWDRFIKESGHNPATYINPFWRPRGIEEGRLPGAKRMAVPADWTLEGQVVGRKVARQQLDTGNDR